MSEVTTLVETHSENGVAGVQQRFVDRDVGIRATVGLHVGVIRAEEGGEASSSEVFYFVDNVVTAVVATSRDSPRSTYSSVLIPWRQAPRGRQSFHSR